jgi:hypothetical protein
MNLVDFFYSVKSGSQPRYFTSWISQRLYLFSCIGENFGPYFKCVMSIERILVITRMPKIARWIN